MDFITKWKTHNRKSASWIKREQSIIYIIAWIIVIIGVSSVVSHYIPQSKLAKENIRQYKILQKIEAIDDIAHEQDNILHDIGSGYNMKRDRLFHIADNEYHKAQYRDEKFRAAEKLNILIIEQNKRLYEIIDQNNPYSKIAQEKFEQLQKEIELLQK